MTKRKEKRKYVRKVAVVIPETITPLVEVATDIHALSSVSEQDILLLPPSLVYQLRMGTEMRRIHKMADNIRERTEQAVRRYRGY